MKTNTNATNSTNATNAISAYKVTDTMNQDDLKALLFKGLKKRTKSKKVLDWFDFEFHTIYEAGRFNGVETLYKSIRG